MTTRRTAARLVISCMLVLAILLPAPFGLGAADGGGSHQRSGRMVGVIVTLTDAPVATYSGGVPGLPATAPTLRGTTKLEGTAGDVVAYRAYLTKRHTRFEADAAATIPGARVLHRYRTVLNGVAVRVPEGEVGHLASLPGVRAIYRDVLLHPHTTRSPVFVGASVLWPRLGGPSGAGEGVIVGVLDTGVWPEHPSFADPDPSGKPYVVPPGSRACQFTGGANPGPAASCNGKLIGAYRDMAAYDACVDDGDCAMPAGDFTSARDSEGHGTHTASTAAGSSRVPSAIFDIARGLVSGIAPRAHVIAYKVCGADGCFASDSVAAVEQAIDDGVDVINFSIGGGSVPYSDPVELAFLDAYAAGVFVAASAGNDGPDPSTVEHRGPWVTTVAASTENRQFLSTVSLVAGNGQKLTLKGASITPGIGVRTPVALASSVGDDLCQDAGPDGAFAGKIVVCRRGVNARIEKSYNVSRRGAVGMLLYNQSPLELDTDNHTVPSVQLQNSPGNTLVAFLGTHTGVKATFVAGRAVAGRGDVMAAFSSRGGVALTLGVNKPDVTAPGVQILAGNTASPADPANPAGELFQAIQGTSMSSPHVAGAAALLRHLNPTWTPGQIKSALMTTALAKGLVKENGVTPFTPFDAGSGRINVKTAGSPGLTFDVPAQDFVDHAADLWTVNYPSLYLPSSAPGSVTVQRTAKSELPKASVWRFRVTGSSAIDVGVPAMITVPAGGTTSFPITVDKSALVAGQAAHAILTMTSGSRLVRMPITAVGTSAPPNLLFTAFTATSPVTASGPITISATVQNSGAGAAGPFFLDFFVSSDATLSNDDVYFVSCQFQGLGAGASGICSGTVAFDPASPVSPGSYDLLAVLDLDGAVAESDETDNVAAVALVVQ